MIIKAVMVADGLHINTAQEFNRLQRKSLALLGMKDYLTAYCAIYTAQYVFVNSFTLSNFV